MLFNHGFSPWVEKIPWRKKWQPTSVFLPGKSHGQRSLADYSPWSCKRMGHDLAAKQQQQRPKQRERNFFLKKPINIGEYRKRGK